MTRLLHQVMHLLILLLTFSCKQPDREEAQEQFRQRRPETTTEQPEQAPAAPAPNHHTPSTSGTPQLPTENQPSAGPETRAGDKVVGVKDGDTIELLRNGETITVRLYGIDTPEKTQSYGQKAKQYTSDLVFGKQVQLVPHNTDRYGRTVGTIKLMDGRSLNEELVRDGYAWHYKAYSNDKKLADLEADARRFKRGLWQEANPVAPWEYRKNKRSKSSSTSTAGAPLPAGAAKRTVYICNSTGSGVYHLTQTCHVLKRCKQEVIAVTEAAAIRDYSRRKDKTCQ
ncbi:thermonuclease family protein [Pontibacter sp. CAU 1760]